MLLQLPGRAHERRNIVSDHLRDNRPSRRIFGNRFEDIPIETGSGMNAEIFGEINIRPAVCGHKPPERQIGYILHWREREDRLYADAQSLKNVLLTHKDTTACRKRRVNSMSLRWGRIVLRMAIPGNKDAEVIGAEDCSAAAVECQTYFFCIAPFFCLIFCHTRSC